MDDQMMLKIEARVRVIVPDGNLLGFARLIVAGCLVVENCKIFRSGDGALFVSMPSVQKDGEERFRDICYPINAAMREEINRVVLEGYAAEVAKMSEIVSALGGQ